MLGQIVLYRLTEQDAEDINRRRTHAGQSNLSAAKTGAQIHAGNLVRADDLYPMLIVRTFGPNTAVGAAVNGQVFLDGNDTYWATSRVEGNGSGQWRSL